MLHKTHRIFIALGFIFAAPGLFALLFYYNPSWLSAVPTHQGQLLQPPKPASFLNLPNHRWQILYQCNTVCAVDCLQDLDALARMRLALGRRLYDVRLSVLAPASEQEPDCLPELEAKAIQVHYLDPKQQADWGALSLNAKLNLMDAKDYVILSYPVDASQSKPEAASVKALYQDLKKLLHTQEQT